MMQFGDQPDIEDNLPKPEDQQQPPQPQYQQPVSVEPQPAQLPNIPSQTDLNSINQAQSLVGGALQGIQTVGNAVDQDQASANQRLAQVTSQMGQDPVSRGLSQVGPGMNWAQNNIINNIPVPGMAGEGLNLASAGLNALGVNAPNLGSVGGVMQAANLPAEQLPNIPGFQSQPQYLQQFEQGAAGAAPYVLGGPESALGKGLSILGGGLGSVADQNLGTQLGPIGAFQLAGMGAGGLLDRGPRPETPTAQPEPAQNFTNAQPSISRTGYPTPEELAFGVQPTAESTGMRAVEPNNAPMAQPLSQVPVEELQRRLDAAQGVIDNTQREADRLIFHEGLSHNDPEVLAANQHITAAEDVWTQLNNELAQRGAYQAPTTTTAPTSTTTTSIGNYWDTTGIGPKIEAEQQRGPYIQWINENIHPDEQRVYKAALADVLAGKQAQAPTPEGTLGPDPQTNPYRIAHDSIRQNLAPDMPYLPAPPPGSGATETPFRAYPGAPREAAPVGEPAQPAGNMVFAEGHDGNIHTITGFNGIRDGQQWFQTETGEVPLSLLKNLSSGDLAELGRMRTAAGATNLPNPQPVTGQPGSPGAQGFQQSPAGQQFAGQGAAGMNVTQPGVSSSNAAPSTTYGGGAGSITGQAPPAGRPPSGGGAGASSVPPRPASVPPTLWTHVADLITAPLKVTMAGFHFFRTGIEGLVHPTNLGNAFRGLGLSITDPVAGATFEKNLRESQPYVAQKLPPGSAIAGRQVQDFQPTPAPLRQGFITQFVNKIPYIGDLLKNTADGNGRFLRILRDSNYNDAAKFISQTVPNADTKFYQDTYDFLNHATGHSTIPGLRGGGVGTTYGAGVQAIAARLQTDVDMFTKSGSPLPWDAGARAEAVKYWMALGGVITATNALGSALGGSLNLPFNLGSIKAANIINPEGAVASNLFKVTTTNAEKTAKTEYGNDVGQSTMLRYLGGMGLAIYHGDTDAMKSLTTSFMRGEAGPIPGWGLDMLLGNEWRNGSIVPYGPKGGAQGMSNLMDDLHAGFISRWANIGVKNLVDSMNAYGPVSGLIRGLPALGAGEVNTSPINTTSQAFKYATTPDTLAKAFQGEDKPLATILQGKDWNDLMSTEKSALTKTLSPEVLQQIHDESYQRNPETTKHSDTVQYIADKKVATENDILDRYNRHELDGPHAANLMKAAQAEYSAVKSKLDNVPAYLAEQQKFDKSNQSGAQVALDGYWQIPTKEGRAAYIAQITQHDPELGTRLLIATQPHNSSKLEELYYSGQLK